MPNTKFRIPQKKTINTPAVARLRRKGLNTNSSRNLTIKAMNNRNTGSRRK